MGWGAGWTRGLPLLFTVGQCRAHRCSRLRTPHPPRWGICGESSRGAFRPLRGRAQGGGDPEEALVRRGGWGPAMLRPPTARGLRPGRLCRHEDKNRCTGVPACGYYAIGRATIRTPRTPPPWKFVLPHPCAAPVDGGAPTESVDRGTQLYTEAAGRGGGSQPPGGSRDRNKGRLYRTFVWGDLCFYLPLGGSPFGHAMGALLTVPYGDFARGTSKTRAGYHSSRARRLSKGELCE